MRNIGTERIQSNRDRDRITEIKMGRYKENERYRFSNIYIIGTKRIHLD